MFKIFKKHKTSDHRIVAPVNGQCIALSKVKDPMFSKKLLGEGCAFVFDDEVLYAPCNGEIIMIATTSHAIGIRSEQGVEILLHIGMDTVELQGKGFDVLVHAGQKVKLGQPIITIDQAFMQAHMIDLVTPMIITNHLQFNIELCNTDKTVQQGISEIIKLRGDYEHEISNTN